MMSKRDIFKRQFRLTTCFFHCDDSTDQRLVVLVNQHAWAFQWKPLTMIPNSMNSNELDSAHNDMPVNWLSTQCNKSVLFHFVSENCFARVHNQLWLFDNLIPKDCKPFLLRFDCLITSQCCLFEESHGGCSCEQQNVPKGFWWPGIAAVKLDTMSTNFGAHRRKNVAITRSRCILHYLVGKPKDVVTRSELDCMVFKWH